MTLAVTSATTKHLPNTVGVIPQASKAYEEGIRLVQNGFLLCSKGNNHDALQTLEQAVATLTHIVTTYQVSNPSVLLIMNGARAVTCVITQAQLATAQGNIRRAQAKIKQLRSSPGPEDSKAALKQEPPPSPPPLDSEPIPPLPPKEQTPSPGRSTLEAITDLREQKNAATEDVPVIPVSKLEPGVALLIMSMDEDNLTLSPLEASLLLLIASQDHLHDKINLENIEYCQFPPELEDVEKIKLAIYGKPIGKYSTSAICGGLLRYLSRGLKETFRDWYMKCSLVERPDFIARYLFGACTSSSREDGFREVRDCTKAFITKVGKEDEYRILNEAEYNLLLNLVTIVNEKTSLAKIKRQLRLNRSLDEALAALSRKLERKYSTLPQRIILGPLRNIQPTTGSAQLEDKICGISNLSSWLELEPGVIASYLSSKDISIDLLTGKEHT